MPVPEGYHPEMQRMAELPLKAESRVLVIGDAALEQVTAAFLRNEYGCTVDVVDESAELDYGQQSFELVVVNSNVDHPIRFPPPERVRFLMVRRYKEVDELAASRWGKVIWQEDLWTLQRRDAPAPASAPEENTSTEAGALPADVSPSSGAETPPPEAPTPGERPLCVCGYEVAAEKNYGIAMAAHQRQCAQHQEAKNAESPA